MKKLSLIKESLLYAVNSLHVNKLRTFLSLIGITIGIFAIISVFTLIDSLEDNIRKSIATLGDNTVYVQKWPWSMGGGEYPWWKYMKRPVINLRDYEEIKRKSMKSAGCFFSVTTRKTVQYKNNSANNISIISVTHDYEQVRNFNMYKGRYFAPLESQLGKNRALIGYTLAEKLFENADPLGKEIKILGRKLIVTGVFEKEGQDMFGFSTDEQVLIPLNFARNILDIREEYLDPFVTVKAKENVHVDELIDELNSILRKFRRLKPVEEENFALNKTSIISKGFDSIFVIINLAGIIIGGFSILVGGFGIANIMFVSVKEQTHNIGIQKSLGAKRRFILFQFLFESVILSLIGGLTGLLLILAGSIIVSSTTEFTIMLSLKNVFTGIFISVFIGIISGLIPARQAAKLDPVVAINS